MASSSYGIVVDYNGVEEAINLFDTHQEILFYLTQKSSTDRCMLTNSRISTRLGKGKQGEVFDITLEDGKKGDYVVKMSEDTLYDIADAHYHGKKDTTIGKLAKLARDDLGISPELFISLNSSADHIIHPGDKYKTLEFIVEKRGCKREKSFRRKEEIVVYHPEKDILIHLPTGRTFVYPPGSYICDSGNHAEYMISVLCGDLKRKGICENFLDVIGFSMCIRNEKMRDYVFMEKIDGDLDRLGRMIKTESIPREKAECIIESIFLQILFAMSVMNRVAGVQHNDLHIGNIFYKTAPNSPKLFKYILDNRNIYIPNEGYIAKIGDFGFAAKYSDPILASSMVIDNEYKSNDIPLWRADSYDLLFFVVCMFLSFGRYSKMICKTMAYIVDGTILDNTDTWNRARKIVYDDSGKLSLKMMVYYNPSYRPTFEPHHLRPWDILTNVNLVGNLDSFHKKARILYGSSHVTMGKLNGYYTNYDRPQFVNNSKDDLSDKFYDYMEIVKKSTDSYENYIDAMMKVIYHLDNHRDDLAVLRHNRRLSQRIVDDIHLIMEDNHRLYEDHKDQVDRIIEKLL